MTLTNLIGQGRTAQVYELDAHKIIKLFNHGYPQHAIENEYHISKMLYNSGLPVANAHNLITYQNRLGIVYDRIQGVTMLKNIYSKPWQYRQYAKKLAELHHYIHQETVMDMEIDSYKNKLITDMQKTDLLDTSTIDKIIAYTQALPEGNKICHGDFHPDNILCNNDKHVVIDWMTATKGNPLGDVARTIVLLEYVVFPQMSRLSNYMVHVFGKKLLKHYIKTYIQRSGVKIEDIHQWKLPVAAARLSEDLPREENDTLIRFIKKEIKKCKIKE